MNTSDSIRILVTDSGLGGLSVLNDILKKIKIESPFQNVELIFADALFDSNSGYNKLATRQEKIDIFNRALLGIENYFKPDIIFIACNTLSVLYDDTSFSKETKTLVVGIVNFGVDLIFNELKNNSNSKAIIYATETTINSEAHKRELVKRGISEERIITKACPQLQSLIERNPNGLETKKLIDKYTSEVLSEISDTQELYISLNCTHFGYSFNFWEEVFESKNIKLKGILDPNNQMANVLFSRNNARIKNPTIQIKIVSKVEMPNDNQKAMSQLFRLESPELSEAIENYIFKPDLF